MRRPAASASLKVAAPGIEYAGTIFLTRRTTRLTITPLKPSRSPMLPTMTCFTAVFAITCCTVVAKFSRTMIASAPESLSVFELTRGVEWIDVHHRIACAQHRGGRYRILQYVRHHQRDARALFQALALQIGPKRRRHPVEIAIADRLVHADEGLAIAEFRKAFFQQLDERLVLGHIDIGGHAGRVLLEPDALHGISPLVYFPRFLGRDACFGEY